MDAMKAYWGVEV